MNNIDILEDFLDYYSFLKTAIGGDDIREFEIRISKNEIKAISNLIAENKELKEKIKEINEEYNAEQKHEMENTIPKSKVKEEIDGKFKEAKGLYERGVQPQAQYTMKLLRDLEQSLLGKE